MEIIITLIIVPTVKKSYKYMGLTLHSLIINRALSKKVQKAF